MYKIQSIITIWFVLFVFVVIISLGGLLSMSSFWLSGVLAFIWVNYIDGTLKFKDETNDDYDKGLRFGHHSGVGRLSCNSCGYNQELHIFTHSGSCNDPFNGPTEDEEYYAYHGYQCQACGKFKTITNPDDDKTYYCTCGGELSNKEIIFCPKCKSQEMQYNIKYIT